MALGQTRSSRQLILERERQASLLISILKANSSTQLVCAADVRFRLNFIIIKFSYTHLTIYRDIRSIRVWQRRTTWRWSRKLRQFLNNLRMVSVPLLNDFRLNICRSRTGRHLLSTWGNDQRSAKPADRWPLPLQRRRSLFATCECLPLLALRTWNLSQQKQRSAKRKIFEQLFFSRLSLSGWTRKIIFASFPCKTVEMSAKFWSDSSKAWAQSNQRFLSLVTTVLAGLRSAQPTW